MHLFGKMEEYARIGLAAHTAVLHKLVSRGLEVLQPLGDHLRYDLAYYWEETGELIRIQCKAARYDHDKGCIFFKNFNRTGGRTGKRKYVGDAEYFGVYSAELNGEGKRQRRGYAGYAEYFGVYSPDTRTIYMIRIDECYIGDMSLRLTPTGKQGKNQFSAGVRWAQKYEL
jgi:hypothetical protein